MSSTITQTELASLVGVNRQNVFKAIKDGHIHTKKVKGKKKIVLNHELTQLWIETQSSKNKNAVKQQSSGQSSSKNTSKDDLISLQREKTIEEIARIKAERRLKELKYSREREELIEKKGTGMIVFKYLDAFNMNMLDIPEIIIDTMIDKIKSKASRGDMIKIIRDMISKEIKNTKNSIKERLK